MHVMYSSFVILQRNPQCCMFSQVCHAFKQHDCFTNLSSLLEQFPAPSRW